MLVKGFLAIFVLEMVWRGGFLTLYIPIMMGIEMSRPYYPGATAVGLKTQEGVILAADKRVTYGFILMSKAGKKVFKITDRAGVASAGFIADMQSLARTLEAEMRLYELNTGLKPTIYSIAKLLSLILYSSKLMPYLVEMVVGGVDENGSHIYVLDPLGAVIEDDYVALGSGAQVAIGVLENRYRKDMNISEARDLALQAVKAAFSRDAISGDGVDLLTIDNSGIKEEFIPA